MRREPSLKFLFSRRWLSYFAFCTLFAIACFFLASWQLHRTQEAAAANALLRENFNAEPTPLEHLLPSPEHIPTHSVWSQVIIHGFYEPDKELLVRNRPLRGQAGFEVLTPFRTPEGNLFIVNRGWIASNQKNALPNFIPPAPQGEIRLITRLKPSEPAIPGRTETATTLGTIELQLFQDRWRNETFYTGAYGLVTEQNPSDTQALFPTVTEPPFRNEGMHWSYMVQWLLFAAIGFFGFGYAVKAQYQTTKNVKTSYKSRRAANRNDAEEEDLLLDLQSAVHREPELNR